MYLTRFKYIPLIGTVKNYKKEYFTKDLIAALTVAVVAIPQSMAYALIAGVNPVYGLYTAIISSILGSAFGSSKHLVTGPTNAICLLVAGSMRNYMGLNNAYQMLFLMTFIVGALQMFYGVVKLGKVINFVSHSVIVGFTAGAGVLIALGQLNTVLSISIKNSAQMPTMEKVYYVFKHINQTNLYALGLGILTILIILGCKKINKNLPGALIGIVVPIVIIILFALDKKGVTLTGHIPSSLPPFKMVQFSFDSASKVFSGAIAVSVIGLVEAISISKSISSTSRQRIDANQEFIGQGISNLVSSFFQCFPSSGSFTRSAINYHNGAVSRFSGIMSGLVIAIVLLFFAPYAQYIPNPCLAGVILVTAYSLIDQEEIKKVLKLGKSNSDSIAMAVTFLATILMPDLDYAIYTGIVLSIILYLKDTNKTPVRLFVPLQGRDSKIIRQELSVIDNKVDSLIIQLEGHLYFGSAYDLEQQLDGLVEKSKLFILEMENVISIDVTSLNALKIFIKSVKRSGGKVIICGVRPDIDSILLKSNFDTEIGMNSKFTLTEEEVFTNNPIDLEKARVISCENDNTENTFSYHLLQSVTNFNGGNSSNKKASTL
ncbi:SulP family inorganic anion transporter [Desulfosporosinus sp. PR]|uniref:SulP family inorganic anion transporter n=1 Tax=Candidatus Desulfosporosinus nitrosoreducens TaxID=3401928 RepID=UPI0027FF2FB5|nr:SulP family inorganic anion transporter [Desulfosporosinus sp. PR]MDQ7092398.1 SulP family inorganic anion transporter [Desulfosporosinus sp. PR]